MTGNKKVTENFSRMLTIERPLDVICVMFEKVSGYWIMMEHTSIKI